MVTKPQPASEENAFALVSEMISSLTGHDVKPVWLQKNGVSYAVTGTGFAYVQGLELPFAQNNVEPEIDLEKFISTKQISLGTISGERFVLDKKVNPLHLRRWIFDARSPEFSISNMTNIGHYATGFSEEIANSAVFQVTYDNSVSTQGKDQLESDQIHDRIISNAYVLSRADFAKAMELRQSFFWTQFRNSIVNNLDVIVNGEGEITFPTEGLFTAGIITPYVHASFPRRAHIATEKSETWSAKTKLNQGLFPFFVERCRPGENYLGFHVSTAPIVGEFLSHGGGDLSFTDKVKYQQAQVLALQEYAQRVNVLVHHGQDIIDKILQTI